MAISKEAREYHERMFPNYSSKFAETDPEFIEIFDNFAFDEVIKDSNLSDRVRMLSILAVLIGCQGLCEYKVMLPATLNFGVKPEEIKETLYQSVAYLGIGRVYPFLKVTNEVFSERGISLPLAKATTTTDDNRLDQGERAQVEIFGERMRGFANSGDEDVRHINRYLTSNCFGAYYTRDGLSYKDRELITFCFLYAQGGCEPQLKSHIAANFRLGNDKDFLISVITAAIPFIGYPRSLNAIRCIKEVNIKD